MAGKQNGFWSTWWRNAFSKPRAVNKHSSGRRLKVEALEGRKMLANDFGAIAGTLYQDQSDNGLTNDDTRLASVSISLYRDGGNGMVGGDDTLVGTKSTGADGTYRFDGLTAGTYFVKRSLPAGYLEKSGSDTAMVVVTAAAANGQAGAMIDSFTSTTQTATATSAGPTSVSNSVMAVEAIGGERDLAVQLTSAAGEISIRSNAFNQHMLEFSSSATGEGSRTITWDGVDNSPSINYTGLNHQDLTVNGTNTALRLSIGADLSGGKATFRVYTNAGNWSSATVDIPVTGGAGTTEVLIPYSSFVTQSGSGANFTNVGAIQLDIEGDAAADGQITAIAAVGPTLLSHDFALFKPMSLGNRVWNDVNNNGLLDTGEAGIGNVAVKLWVDSDNSGDLSANDTALANTTTDSQGFYRFDNLFPNGYIVQVGQSNFSSGAALFGLKSSTGNEPTPDPDNDVDNDDNGDPLVGNGVAAKAVTLVGNSEPVNDGDTNANSNLTVDFGFYLPKLDLLIDKNVSATTAKYNDTLTYTIYVTNDGPLNATGVKVVDSLPAGLTYVSSTTTQGTTSNVGQQLTYVLGNMAVGATATIVVQAKVTTGATGELTNTAVVSGDQDEIRYDNNEDHVTTTLTPIIDVAITKTGTPAVVAPNATETYTLVVTNNGPSAATGVKVVDTLPAGITFTGATPGQGTYTANGNVVTFVIGNLAVGASTTIVLTGLTSTTARGTLTNVADVTANEIETTYVNNHAEFPVTIVPPLEPPLPPPVQAVQSSLAGNVYVDSNNNGVKETGESPIAGVTINLTGTDNLGNPVARTTTTAADGSYIFSLLDPGVYSVIEVQPTAYDDGLDTIGSPSGGTAAQDDALRTINLAAGVNATNYNFGERRRYTYSKYMFLASR